MYSDTLEPIVITTDQFDWSGELLFGRNWKTEMAEILGLKDAARIREIIRGRRPIPKHVGAKVLDALRSRIDDLADIANEIEQANTDGDAALKPVEGQSAAN